MPPCISTLYTPCTLSLACHHVPQFDMSVPIMSSYQHRRFLWDMQRPHLYYAEHGLSSQTDLYSQGGIAPLTPNSLIEVQPSISAFSTCSMEDLAVGQEQASLLCRGRACLQYHNAASSLASRSESVYRQG